ncbi:MAG: protein-L-isoaspartate O-methyltransferase [Caulobacteraceae bacterium]
MTLDFNTARVNMVENQVRTNDVTDLPIQDAMRVIRRERLCPPGKAYLAYAEGVVEYAPGWFLMQARDTAKLLQAIFPVEGETALAIAAPYAAAVLARMGLATRLVLPKGVDADAIKAALDDPRIEVTSGDLQALDVGKSFDVAICEGAVARTPRTWIDAIGVGGRLGVIERTGPMGKARIYERGPEGLVGAREVFDASPPVLPGFDLQPSFAF